MLALPTDQAPLVVLGIDPGTSTLGLAQLLWDLEQPQAIVRTAHTLHMNERHGYQSVADQYSPRFARLQQLSDLLTSELRFIQPHVVMCEAPFMGKSVTTFRALSECFFVLQQAVYHYNPQVPFLFVSPYSLKESIGVSLKKGNGLDKDDNVKALRRHPGLLWDIEIESLDEHSVDAVGAATHYLVNEGLIPCG